VEQRDGGDEEPPNEHLRTIRAEAWGIGLQEFAEAEHAESANRRDQGIESIQEDQFRKLGEIADALEARREKFLGADPADMSPKKSSLAHRVSIFGFI